MVAVRRVSVLPAASFRSRLATGTLAVQLTIPPAGVVGDLHPQVMTPCLAHKQEEARAQMSTGLSYKKTSATTYSSTSGSTIGATGLNFSVRNGKRWTPCALITEIKLWTTNRLGLDGEKIIAIDGQLPDVISVP